MEPMLSPAVQAVVNALSPAEKVELRNYLIESLRAQFPLLSEEQKDMIRSRAAEMDADPFIGISWEQVNAELEAEFR